MKKALISPAEIIGSGFRVAEVCDETFPVAEPLYWVECDDSITSQHVYSGSAFSLNTASEPPQTVQTVSALQGLLAVDQAGMAAAYSAWTSDPSRTFAEKAFIDKALTWKRNDPTLLAAATAFGLTSQQLDELFTLAATL